MNGAHKTFQEAARRNEQLTTLHERLVPLAAAIIAVLAALGTLFSHHRSITALSVKNEAILLQSKASDQYNYYEARRIKYTVYSALASGGIVRDPAVRKSMQQTADHEQTSSLAILTRAQDLERQAEEEQQRSAVILKSFETLEIATTLFEVAIVLVSISALSETRVILYFGCGISAVGIIFLAMGLLQAH